MITLKNHADIEILKSAGRILSSVLDEVIKNVKPGITTIELDQLAEKLIIESGAEPSFKNYCDSLGQPKFPTTLCTSVNEEVVHAAASKRVLADGDIVGIDVGLKYPFNGRFYFSDMAKTVPVGRISALARKLIKVTRQALEQGIAQIKPGNYIHDISRAIQNHVEKQGFSVVKDLVGHGVGYKVHEPPRIPNYVEAGAQPIILKTGMVLAIEPMVNVGGYHIETLEDGWTVVTADRKLSAHFEHTVAVTESGHEILTLSR